MLLRSEMLCSNINCDYTSLSTLSLEQWRELMELSRCHGVKYLVFEVLSHLPPENCPAPELYLQWYVDSVSSQERSRLYIQRLEELSTLMSENGIPIMVIKGYALTRLYKSPHRRECGDIDIFLFGKHRQAEALVSNGFGRLRPQNQRSKHSQFVFKGINVDNHKTFVADAKGLTPKLELFYGRIEQKIQDSIAKGDMDTITLGTQTIYTLNMDMSALHLITHTLRHVVTTSVAIRHYCDWVTFFDYNRKRLDRDRLLAIVEECELGKFVANVEAFCAERLGYQPFFNIGDRYEIERTSRSIENNVMGYKGSSCGSNIFKVILNSIRKMISSQRYYAAYIGLDSYWDYLIPNFIARIKQLCR